MVSVDFVFCIASLLLLLLLLLLLRLLVGNCLFAEIGRPMDLTVQKQSFKATAWLADSFPLSLRDQVLPVIELIVRAVLKSKYWCLAFLLSLLCCFV